MNSLSDQQLLRDYVAHNSDAAFAELVRRHVDLVYSAALRMVCDAHLAKDVTQSAFVALAKNARQLSSHAVLSGWLHRTAQNLAANAVRSDVRRRAREQEAAAMNQLLANESEATWKTIAPHLDAALGELNDAERDALLLRYFECKSAREMADILSTSEDAAQKRVSRAVERLREFFSKQKITIGASGLVVLISANAVQSAPIGLSTAILTATAGITATLGMTMIHKILITGFAAAAIGSGVYAVHLQKQIAPLQQQQTSLNQQLAQLSSERDNVKNQLAAAQQENEQLRDNENELLKLRGEAARLRQQQNVLPETSQTETKSRAERKSIYVGTTFVSFPAEDLQSLGVEWTSDAQGGKVGVLTEQQYKNILQAMQGANDVHLINSPHVISDNGQTAEMSVSRTGTINGTNMNTGISLTVVPHFFTNSSTFNLDMIARLNLLSGDPSQPNLLTTQMTNHLVLSPGQTVVVEQDCPNGGWLPNWAPNDTNIFTGPSILLVFVTPSIVNARDYERPGSRPGTAQRVAGIWGSPTNFDERGLPKSQ